MSSGDGGDESDGEDIEVYVSDLTLLDVWVVWVGLKYRLKCVFEPFRKFN